MDSYCVELKISLKIDLVDEDVEIKFVLIVGGGSKLEVDLDQLSNIIKVFNDQFGNINWKDNDKICWVIVEEILVKVVVDVVYQNVMRNNDKRIVRIEYDVVLQWVMIELLVDYIELFKQFSDNQFFKKWLGDIIFGVIYWENWEVG